MSRRLLVSALPGEQRLAWLEGDDLVDFRIFRADRPSYLGNLYHGRVTKIDKALGAAFLALGLGQEGFLPLSEAPGRKAGHKLGEGDSLAVRVVREAQPGKGLRLSGRLKDPPPGLQSLLAEKRAPALLWRAEALPVVLEGKAPPDEILADDFETLQALKGQLDPAQAARLKLYQGKAPLFEAEAVEAALEALLEPEVPLPSGARLLIEPVRTLTAIDVDSGRQGARGQAALDTNLEAAREIARQLPLRGLSGLIVIDFLEPAQRGEAKQVVSTLRAALKSDPEPCRIQPMAPSGLVEMTRRRGRLPLHEVLTRPCGLGGGGREKDPITLGYEALRAARAAAKDAGGKTVALAAAAEVLTALDGPLAAARRAVEAEIARPITLRPLVSPAAGSEITKAFEVILE